MDDNKVETRSILTADAQMQKIMLCHFVISDSDRRFVTITALSPEGVCELLQLQERKSIRGRCDGDWSTGCQWSFREDR